MRRDCLTLPVLEEHLNANGKDIGGVVPIIPVPFDAGESVDEGALRRLVDFAVACKVDAVCLPAYGSEFYKLSEEERTRVVAVAVEQAAGRLKVVAQCNHGSSRVASSLAGSNLEAGADLVSIAIPRQFPVPDEDLLRFLAAFLDSFTAPCLLQDFNPGGPTLSAAFLARLRAECPNLAYLKLEEPLSASKVAAMVEATGGEVGILTGWGGLYMMELIPAGICGLMPGLGLADLLNRIFWLAKEGDTDQAFHFFERIVPLLFLSLQHLELYHYCEKRLLQARGRLEETHCRQAAYQPDIYTREHLERLLQRALRTLEDAGLGKDEV
ncbi:MAG: dihydrodipicolinate synthase family protein [Acidobacteria bacterium]|nr:dihydrodipicolinate synthase family protein [Acidobacteriota bacterium]